MSLLSRRKKNRRFEREHMLDVKLRSKPLQLMRLRVAAMAIGASFAVLFGVFMAWHGGQWAMNEFLFQNESFAIDTIDIQTDGVIPIEQLRQWAGVKNGDNLLSLDLARVKRDLELVPLIESVGVQRVLPRSLKLSVTEREPVAQVHVYETHGTNGMLVPRVFYLDRGGFVIPPLVLGARTVPESCDWLPTITGVPPNDLRPGRAMEASEVHAALDFLSQFEKSSMMSAVEIKFVDASNSHTLTITTEQGSEITFSITSDFTPQLRRWRTIYDLGGRSNKALASLDLAVANYLPARWIEDASLLPAVKPRSKTSAYRKRHV